MSLLECKNLCVGYSSKTVCENLNFCVEKGDFVFIIGSTASGKSTLIKTLYREEKVTKGSVYVGGVNVSRLKNWRNISTKYK